MKEGAPPPERLKLDNDFYLRFLGEDQKAMHTGNWPYHDPDWQLNKWKSKIEQLDDSQLSEEERTNKWHALWLWYHHASQFAFSKGDRQTALAYVDKAMEYHVVNPGNQITPLLKFLYEGKIEEARVYAETIPERVVEPMEDGSNKEIDNPEKEAAASLIEYFEAQSRAEEKPK